MLHSTLFAGMLLVRRMLSPWSVGHTAFGMFFHCSATSCIIYVFDSYMWLLSWFGLEGRHSFAVLGKKKNKTLWFGGVGASCSLSPLHGCFVSWAAVSRFGARDLFRMLAVGGWGVFFLNGLLISFNLWRVAHPPPKEFFLEKKDPDPTPYLEIFGRSHKFKLYPIPWPYVKSPKERGEETKFLVGKMIKNERKSERHQSR